MFYFTPAAQSSFGYPSAYQQQPRRQPRPSAGERYLAAIAEAKAAEAEYLASLEPQRSTAPFWGSYQGLDDVYSDSYEDLLSGSAPYTSYGPQYPQHRYHQHNERARRLAVLRLQQEEEHQLNLLRKKKEIQERLRLAAVLQQQQKEEEDRQAYARRQQLQRQQEVGLKRKIEARQEIKDVEDFLRVLFGIVSDEENTTFEQPKAASKPEGYGPFACGGRSAAHAASTSGAPAKVPVAQPTPAAKPTGCAARSSCRPGMYYFRPASAPAATPAATKAPASLKAELEARLANEKENEIRDTIQALMASLTHPQPSSPVQAESSGKGKAKAPATDSTPAAPTEKDIARSFAQINQIERTFVALEDSFEFPTRLDFSPPASPSPSVSSSVKLAYTSNNAPLHNYQHALSGLLGQLDAVESYGHEEVRHRRKEVVDRVEGALEGVERRVEEKGELESRRTSLVEEKAEDTPVVEGYSVEVEDSPAPAYVETKEEVTVESPLDPLEGSVQHPLNFDTLEDIPATEDSSVATATKEVSESVATITPEQNSAAEPIDLTDSEDEEELGEKSFLLSADTTQEIPTEVKKPNVTDEVEDGAGSDWSEVEA